MSGVRHPWTAWLLPLIAAAVLAVMGWGGQTLVAQGERVTRVEQGQEDQGRRLGRIEWKIDRLLERP